MSTTDLPAIRVSRAVYERIRGMVQENHETLGAVIARLVRQEEERQFWAQVNADFDALRADPEAWAEEVRERALWEWTPINELERDGGGSSRGLL
jgi:hypothetical protein